MFHKGISIFIAIFIFCSELLHGQQQDEQLANQFAQNGEWAKAADLYEKLANKAPSSMYYYDNLLKAYLELKQENAAIKLVKKQNKKFPRVAVYAVDQAYISFYFGNKTIASDYASMLIKQLNANEQAVTDLSMAFAKRGFLSEAIQSYLRGRELLRNEQLFCSDLAALYTDIDNRKAAIEEWVKLLSIDPSKIEEIQGLLQHLLQNNQDFDNCKTALIKQYKQFPDDNSLQDMLIWFYVQRADYNSALIFTRKIDKKQGLNGRRTLELGLLAFSNNKFDDAITIYSDVCSLGPASPFYYYAKQELLSARTQKLLSGNYTQADLLLVETEYNNLLAKEGDDAKTRFSLASLQFNYLHNNQAAILNFSKAIQLTTDRNFAGTCKLALADVYIVTGEVWESMLLFGQVDKDFMEEPMGQEAKFRSARLSYFLGEFDWAKAQLDVLKTATTQLIANNAMELSLLIQENTIDSNQDALKLFARADLLATQQHFQEALSLLDSVERTFPKNVLFDDLYYKRGEIAQSMRQFELAAQQFEKVYTLYATDVLADQAVIKAAQLFDYKLNKPQLAMHLYELLIKQYPGSVYSNEARKRYRLLRGDQFLNQQEPTK
jgi:predicted Zn-dependent protease